MHFNIKNILLNYGFSDKNDYKNIYINLYDSIKEAIINKALDANVQLPPSRVLAKDIGTSRSTVIKAYELLILEKYIRVTQGSGYYVEQINNEKVIDYKQLNNDDFPKISKNGLSFKKNIQIINNNEKRGIAFRPGLPPLDIFPVAQWQKLSNNYWSTITSSELSYSSPTGIRSLKENILNYLKIYRNISCDLDQIVITTGSLHSLFLIGSVLIDPKDEIIIENPTYPFAHNLFRSLNAKIHSVDIDDEGICISEVNCKNAKLVYTTPSNQHPTGVKMSLQRRLDIMQWAQNKNAFIIEDDYDHEFSNWENPIPPIHTLGNSERVIYLGSFNKILHPSIRLGYMVVPHYLLDSITGIFEQSNRFVSPSIQKTLSYFIQKDYLNRHLRNVIEVSKEREEVFSNYFTSKFENEIMLNSNSKGLNVIGLLKKTVDDKELSKYLNEKGITTFPYSNYFYKGIKKNGLVMGYSSVNKKLIKEKIIKMEKEYKQFLRFNNIKISEP